VKYLVVNQGEEMQRIVIYSFILAINFVAISTLAQTEEQYFTQPASIREFTIKELAQVDDTIFGKMTVVYPSYCYRIDTVKTEIKGNIIQIDIILRAPLEMACPDREKVDEHDIVIHGLKEGAYTVRLNTGKGNYAERAIRLIRSEDQTILKIERTIGTGVVSWLFFPDGIAYFKEEDQPIKFLKVFNIRVLSDFLKVIDNKNFFALPNEDIVAQSTDEQAAVIYTIHFKSTDPQLGTKDFKYSFHEKKSLKYIKKKLNVALMNLLSNTK
jgi:hypothetical protein